MLFLISDQILVSSLSLVYGILVVELLTQVFSGLWAALDFRHRSVGLAGETERSVSRSWVWSGWGELSR